MNTATAACSEHSYSIILTDEERASKIINFIIAIKRTNSAVIATLQQSHEGLPKSIFLSQSSVESRD